MYIIPPNLLMELLWQCLTEQIVGHSKHGEVAGTEYAWGKLVKGRNLHLTQECWTPMGTYSNDKN